MFGVTAKVLLSANFNQLKSIRTMEHLCKCNNCDNILLDENPQIFAIKHKLKGGELSMIQVNVSDENDGEEYIWACPICATDGFLTDIEG